MENSRKFSRFNVGFECQLRVNTNNSYKALLYDLSFGGARVLVDDVFNFRSGVLCELVLNGKQMDLPVIQNSKVIWVDSEKIGLSFQILSLIHI